jgi:hypothetical protein
MRCQSNPRQRYTLQIINEKHSSCKFLKVKWNNLSQVHAAREVIVGQAVQPKIVIPFLIRTLSYWNQIICKIIVHNLNKLWQLHWSVQRVNWLLAIIRLVLWLLMDVDRSLTILVHLIVARDRLHIGLKRNHLERIETKNDFENVAAKKVIYHKLEWLIGIARLTLLRLTYIGHDILWADQCQQQVHYWIKVVWLTQWNR